MPLIQEILRDLEENRGTYRSGESLAARCGVSRAAVWKAVKSLKGDGYPIDASPKLGYRLSDKSDLMSVEGIRARLSAAYRGIRLELLPETDSTNNELKRRGARGDCVLIAERQTGGRGRSGKSFFSPPGTSVYASFSLDPKRIRVPFSLVTTAAAVATSRAIFRAVGLRVEIKWVNDLYLNGKKIVGILTEAVTSVENGEIENLIVGIGINVRFRDVELPEEIRRVAGALETNAPRNTIAAALIEEVYGVLYGSAEDVLPYAREHSYLLGKTVEYVAKDTKKCGIAEELDEEGHLVVLLPDGSRDVLAAGEVSVRPRGVFTE